MVIEKISNSNKQIYRNFLFDTLIDANTISYGAKVSDDFAVGIILAKKNKLEKDGI